MAKYGRRIGTLVAIALICLTPAAAGAAQIIFDGLSLEQGFNHQSDNHDAIGFLTSWDVAGTTMTPDVRVKDPTGATLNVVGVLSSYSWDSSVGGPMNLHFNVSVGNRDRLLNLLHQQITDTSETFSLTIWEFDPVTSSWFVALQPTNPPLQGLIQKSGSQLALGLPSSLPDPTVQSPVNYAVTTSAVPNLADGAQGVRFATGTNLLVVKQWGTGAPPTDNDLALVNTPSDITTPATSSAGAVVTYTPPTATDEGGESPAVTCDPASGSTFPVGTTTVACTASDSDDSNSPVSTSFDVTVTAVTPTDADLALENVPSDITTPATSSAGAVVTYTPPTATDEGGESPAVTCNPASGSTFPVGTTTVACTASDSDDANGPVSASFNVIVTAVPDDDLALTSVPADISTPATNSAGAVVTYTPPTATDEGGESPVVTCDPASGSTFPVGTTTVTCTASDSDDANSPVSTSFNVTVTALAQSITFTSTPPTPATVAGSYTVSAAGGDSGNLVVFSVDPVSAGACSIVGATVSFDAAGTCVIDANQAGNSQYQDAAQQQQTVTIVELCEAGSYSATGAAPCIPAPPGSYVATTGATSATPCVAGTYQPDAGRSSCLAAPPGSYVGTTGATSPTLCAAGSYQPASGPVELSHCAGRLVRRRGGQCGDAVQPGHVPAESRTGIVSFGSSRIVRRHNRSNRVNGVRDRHLPAGERPVELSHCAGRLVRRRGG